jgi:hypothetical protein
LYRRGHVVAVYRATLDCARDAHAVGGFLDIEVADRVAHSALFSLDLLIISYSMMRRMNRRFGNAEPWITSASPAV